MSAAADLSPAQSEQIIYTVLRTSGLPDPISKIITAQSGHETAGWTSNVYYSFNNVAGYGYTGGGNYLYRDSIEQSVQDVIGWLNRHIPGYQDITDPTDYATRIRSAGYYTDSAANYAAGLRRWYDDNLQIAAGVGVAALVGIGLLVFLLIKKK